MKPLHKPTNFGELRARIEIMAVLDDRTRCVLVSNVKRFAEIVGLPADLIPCDIDRIRQLMKVATPAAYDVGQSNWAKIRSGVWRALELAGFRPLRNTGVVLTHELAELLEQVPMHPDQTELTSVVKFCVDQQLSPWVLTQKDVPLFREWLKPRYVRANWSRAMKKSLTRWKRCQATYGNRWPQAPLVPEYENRDWALPWSAMTTLEAVVDEHLQDLRRPRKRRHGGFRKAMADTTIAARKGYLRRMASAICLAMKPMPETLEDITNPELVEAGVDYILGKRKIELSGDVYQMLRHVNAIARHHVKRSATDLQELKEIRKSVAPLSGPAEKNRKLIEKFRDAGLRDTFIEAPARVLLGLKRKRSLSRSEVVEAMMAFLAALLTKIPMRISEAMALKFGETFHDHGSGRNRQVVVDLPADLVKNDMPRNALLGPKLIGLYDLYKSLILKRLSSPGNPYLFPAAGSSPRSADHMSRQLAAWTTRHVIRMTAHQWRHVVGYVFLRENPGCYDTVRRFLGHKHVSTTIKYYAFVLEDDANEALDQTIDRLHVSASQKLRRSGRRR